MLDFEVNATNPKWNEMHPQTYYYKATAQASSRSMH